MNSSTVRDEYVSAVVRQLFGPAAGEQEWLPRNNPPHKRYIAGILFPWIEEESESAGLSSIEEQTGSVVADPEQPDDSPLADMLQRSPASAGMTFAVSADAEVRIDLRAGRYEKSAPVTEEGEPSDGPKGFQRRPLSEPTILLSDAEPGDTRHGIFGACEDPLATLRVRWRRLGDCRVVTVSIVNNRKGLADKPPRPQDCLYQVCCEASCQRGSFVELPGPDVVFDLEERSLRLRYRRKIQWATGHAASVSWAEAEEGSPPDRISLDFTPVCDTHPFSAGVREEASFDPEVLSISRLSRVSDPNELRALLDPFLADFEAWLSEQTSVQVGAGHDLAKGEVLEDLKHQQSRLRHGMDVLCSGRNPNVFAAFRLANQGMLTQMERMAYRAERPFDENSAKWRPFQLAFQLLSIPGTISDDEQSGCDLVDLVWFPTGGGKTEAYLLLAAFVIIYRRLEHGRPGEGTCILSRYTLRLLTSQQFDRTATLTCALEHMRRAGLIPGQTPISIGLWIGGGAESSPNTKRTARALCEKMLEEDRPRNRFMLTECPWCGKSILPERRGASDSYGITYTNRLAFNCPDGSCHFHDELPVQVVDECMYEDPPTILLATIDKFARMPWEARSRAFFGIGKNFEYCPPDLVIQDELHLISGPLGTIAAIYEAAIDQTLQHPGGRPKYVAATATIRGAAEQSRRLYGRESRIFPAPGLDVDDSYFMKIDPDDTASRRYIGVMGQGRTPVTSTVHTMAAMVHAGGVVSDGDEYWTLVAYHNSRRELGKTMTLAKDDVPARIKVIATGEGSNREPERPCHEVVELSGNLQGYEIPRVLDRMKKERSSNDAIDILPCTNMISVGVDVDRLNAMLILGQPKMSSEYIQASSRVGRGREIGGVVVAAFSPTKPRDRSHYENFLGFHGSMYRWVEPTSVTPQSPAALDRALHAALILALRMQYLRDDEDARYFDLEDLGHKAVVDAFRERLHQAVPAEDRAYFDEALDKVISWWQDAVERFGSSLNFESQSQFKGLMQHFAKEHRDPARPTLNSMRNVDGEARAFVRGGNH